MTTIHVIDRDGAEHEVEATDNAPLMWTLRDLDYGVAAICGGMCSCATCHVYLDEAWTSRVAQRDVDEEDLLESLELVQSGSRLSCQIVCTQALDGLRLTLAPEE